MIKRRGLIKAANFKISEEKILENEQKSEIEMKNNDIKQTLMNDIVQNNSDNESSFLNKNKNIKETKDKEKKDKKKFRKNEKNKKSFYERVAKKRIDEGKIILSQKVETKIYKLKKALKKKGIPEEEVRDIIRKRRREEELKYRKEQKTLCFKCRKSGHVLADCPQESNRDELHDICYFCGSGEHKLHECAKYKQTGKKNVNLPYVKCFVCGKSGHLTRDCKNNEKGAFPKGGKCILCGSINHLVKNCPREDEKKKDIEINLSTYENIGSGIDTDDFNFELSVDKQKNINSSTTKAKVVNFC